MGEGVGRCEVCGSPVVVESSGEGTCSYRPVGMLPAYDLEIIADALERVLRSRPAQPVPMEWRERCRAALAIVRGVQGG